MAKGFNLTAELNLRGPGNLKQIASAIRREIGTIDATVKVKLDKSAERSILNTSNALARLNKELQITAQSSALTTNNITSLVGAINSLGGALSGSSSSMSQIVSSAQATTQQMAKLKKGTVEARSEMEEFGRQSALAVRRFAAFNLATGVIFGLIGAVSKATMEFIEFDKQIVRLTQITGESYEQLSRITDTITGLSTGLGVASSDLIKISDTLAQAGFSARETDQALRALALTALAPSFENLNETVEGSIALMRQFKISTEDLDKALGSINAVAAGFAVEASDIITAIQRTGGVFAAASKGVSQGTDALNEFIAVFTSVRATTRESAETIATGLRTIFTRIQREDTIDALKEYGVNLLDVEGKFVGAYKAVQLLSQGLSKLDPRDTSFSRIVEELGGFRQIGKVLPLIQEFSTAQQALGVAQRGQSSLALDAVKAQSSLAVQFSKTRESFVALIRDIGNSDSFKTLVSLGLTLANTFIKVADVAKPLLPIITAIGAIKGAKALTSYVGGFIGGLRKNKPSSGGPGSPTAGGEDQAAAARSQQIADSYANNSTALNNTTSALNNLTTAISPLTTSIDNLGNGVMTQLLNEITALNNNLSSLPPGGGTTLNRGGVVRKFAKGGSVPGSGNTDSVPALLTPGEFVVNKKAARAVGSSNLHKINNGVQKFKKGGGVADVKFEEGYDGDSFNVNFTPADNPYSTKTRLEGADTYEIKGAATKAKYNSVEIEKGEQAAAETTKWARSASQSDELLKAFQASNKYDNFGRPMFKSKELVSILKEKDLLTGRFEEKNLGGLIQKFEEGGVAQRKVGYIDYDVIANEANKDVVEKGMKETGSDGPRIYSDYLTKLAVNARKSANIQKLRAIYGVAGSGKTTLARGQGTDNARLRQTERFPILSPEDIDRATEILILTSSVSQTKMEDFFGDVDRAYTLSSTTDAERQGVKSRKESRDVTGIGLENRKPGTTMGVSTDSAVGEALLSDKLGAKSTVLGRSDSGRLRRKKGNELVDIVKKRIGLSWGGFAPTTAGHESLLDAAAAMGIPPEDFIALVGANEAVDASSYRTAIFDQDARVLLAKAGFGARGATVLPKPRDFEVPQGFDITQQDSDRRQVLLPDKGSTVFVADKTEKQIEKYKEAGYNVKTTERTGGISGTGVRDLMIAGDMTKLQSVLSPGVYDLISNNIGRIQNRSKILPSLIKQAQEEAQGQVSQVDQQIEALGIKRIDSEQVESDPEYAAKVEVLKELRAKKQKMKSAAGFTPYKLLDALAQKDPQNYALDFSAPAIMGNVPEMRVMGQSSQAPEAPMPVGRVAQLAQEKNKSIQAIILEQLGALGGPAGVKQILGIGSGDRTLSSLLQAGNIKGGKGLEEAAEYVNKALSAKGIRDAAEAKRLEEYQAQAMHFGIAGLLPMDYSKEFEWDIGGTEVYATARGFGSTYLEEARQMQKESSALAQRFAENVQNKNIFGGGEKLAFDFDKTLVEDADILDAKGKPDIAKYSNRDAVQEALKNARPTRLAAKLKSLIEQDPPFIKKTRILTARPQSTADLLAQSLQSFGLPYAATDITGVSGGPSSNIAALKAANLQQEEKLIDDSLDNIMAVRKAGKKGFQYTEPKSTTSELDEKMGQGNIEGAIVEKALAVLGAPIRPDAKQNRAIDYPDGLGSAAQFFPGIDPGIPTEVKRTIDGTSLEKVREEIGRYMTGGAEAVKLAGGGKVKLYHGSNTGVDDATIKSFKEKGALSDIAKGYGQGAGLYVYSGKQKAKEQAQMRVGGGLGSFTSVSGDTSGKPMVVTFEEALNPATWDLDYELNKGSVVEWLVKNYDQLKDKLVPTENLTGIKDVVKQDRSKGIMSAGIRVQEGDQTMVSDTGEEMVVKGGARKTIYSGTDSDLREGQLVGQIMNRLQSHDPETVYGFENQFFKSPSLSSGEWDNLALKYVGSTPLQPTNIETFAEGGMARQRFMDGGTATKTRKPKEVFGTGETKFPARISKKYAEEKKSADERAISKLAWDKNPKDERIMVDKEKVQEAYQQPFDRDKFAASFKEKISRDSLFARMSDFAKFVGLPQEDLAATLPLQLDFGASKRGGGLGMFASAQFEKGAAGVRPYEGYDLSKFGYGEKEKQESYGLEKLIAAKEKEIKKITKTPTQTFDDGSFSFDREAYSKANVELDTLKNRSFKLKDLKREAEKASLAEQNNVSSATGRGTVSFAPSMGYASTTPNSTLYHEMTHQLFEGLRTRSAESFDKYRSRVSSLFSGDNDDLADAFDSLTADGGYSSADVVYGRSYKSNALSQMLSNYYRQNGDSSRGAAPIPEDITKNLAILSTQSTTAKKAREYRPINPKVNEALLQGGDKLGITQQKIDKMEDNGKEEFLTTLMERAPKLDSRLQPILDSTLTELLGGAGIQRQKFATGGVAQLTPPPPPSPPKKPDPNAQVKAIYQDKEMDAIKKKWPIGNQIESGEWKLPGHKSKGGGQFAGEHKELTDFGGSGWKMRLDPKTDKDNILIADWFGKNKSLFSGYKIATNTDKPVWSAYVSRGTGPEIQKAAQKAQSDLGQFITLNQAYDTTDTMIPGTGISGRFEIRGDERSGTPRANEIVDTINERRKATTKYKNFYLLYKQSPGFQKGFPSSTSGQGGVPGTHYFQWLMQTKKDAVRGKSLERAKELQAAQDEEIKLIESVLKEKTPEYSFDTSKQSSSPRTRLAPPPPPAPPKKFANGGIVPGSGNRDTVPASLTAGDFVIRKSSVAKLGLGGSQGFASGGQVPALLTPGELVVPQAQAKKIGYGKLNTMNKFGRYNKGGAVGIQRFEMGGEVLTPAEMSIFRSSMAAVMATFSDEVSSAVDKIDIPTINTSSWDTMRKSLDEINKVMRNSFATVSDDVINKMRKMTSAGRQALEDIDLERVKARQNEIASSRGYSSADRDKMKSDVADASDARGSVRDRKIKNNEREAEGKAPFPVLDLMEMMRSAVGRKPDPINVKPPVSSDNSGRGTKSAEDYRSELNYSDVQTPGPIGPRGELYAQALSKEDPTDINTVVKELRTSFEAAMASIGKQPSKIGKSQSWATWDIGKQLHMRENPQESSDKYKLSNPLDDGKLRLQMVQRQVGYEVSGGKDKKGKNIPSFELVEIGAKAMAESLSKNEAALDAFINTLNSLNRSLYTKEDILGSSTSGSTTVPPIPSPSGVPTAPPVPVPPVVPPITPPTVPPKPPVPPTSPPSGGPNPGNAEAAVERYMAAMEAAAKAVKMQTYEAERLAGATASEAKARADAAGQAAAQALAQQRLVGATTEETIAIADAITRTSKVKGGGTLSRDDMKLPAQALARGGAPAPDTTDYAAATKANIDSINSMTDNFMKFSVALAASEGVSEFVGLVGKDSALGQAVNNLVSSFTSTSALFIAADGAISAFTNVLSSEKTADYLNNFSDYLTSASRGVENFSAGFSGSAAKGVLDRIASGLGSGSGMIGKIAGNLPQIASGVSGALSSLAGPVGAVVTAFNVASSLFIGITDSLRQSKLDASIKAFDDNLKYAEQALNTYSRNTTENAGQLQLANAAIMSAAKEARTQSDITKTNPQWSMTNIIGEGLSLGAGGQESVSQRAEILDKKGMMAYIGSLTDVTGRTQEQYTRELIPQKAAETAEKFKKPAELQQRVFEERFKKGESSSDIMSSPDWKQQAEVLARSNAATEQQLRSIDADLSLSQQARDVKKQELMAIVAANGVRDQEVKYIRNKNSEDANDASSKMLYGLERMLGNMEQSINVVTYSMNKLADQTDLLKASMTGDAKIGATRIDASNVLQNPNMYSSDERSKAADVGSQFFGPQAQDMKGLLQFGPDLENTILSTINRTIQEDPGASSGKIEARISQNIERDLGNLNIDEGLKKTLSKDISSSLSESQKSGDDKINYQQVFGEASAFSKTVQATKRAQEAAVKALEFYQQSVNNYAQSMNEAVALQMSSNEKMRRADDIRVRGEMTLAKTLGKSISLESSKSAANAGVMSQAGTSDPRQIMNNIGRLEMTRQNQQASVDASAQRGPKGSKDLMAFTSQLSGTTMQLRDNYAALKSLADSTEVADAALSKMSEIKAKNEAGLGILERFISSTPKEQAKLNQSFERLDRNMNGQANNMWDSMRVQEAYNDALKNGGSMQDAQEAADQAAAQDRGDTMEAFKMLAPYLGDNQNDLKANMLESMMTESGVEMSPMFNQVLEGLRSPESDPEMAAALNEYKTANALQVQANQYLAALDGTLAQQIGTQAQAAFSNSLAGVNQLNANANANDIKEGINKLNNHLQTGVTKVSTVSSGTTKEPPIPGMAKGGVVEYMAVGGSIFKPKGSDTVPAMLTPGEFVVNKSAASANGPLLHAMNNGYSKGGSVKYYSEGGWVSDMLKPPDAGRFKDADPKKKQIYTKYNDYATFGGGDDIKKNLDTLKSEEGFIQFIKPYSVPTFNGTSEKLYSSMGNPLLDQINGKINESIFGVLPDFTLSRNVLSSAAAGGLKGAAVGTAIRAGAGSSFGATAGAAASNATGTVDGAPLGIGGSLGGYVWEAMKFVPGLGAAISGIDAVRELLKGNFGAAAIEGLGAVLNLIPIPGASFIGKPLTGALKFLLKKMPFLSTFGAKIGEYVPRIFKSFAPGLYDSVGKFFSKNTQDLVMDLIPSSWKKKLGTMAWKMTGSATTGTAIADAAASVAPTLVKNAIPGMAGIGAASGAVSAISGGAVPNIQTSVADKLKSSMVMSNFKYPSSLNSQDILENKINTGADALSLDEAKEQFQTITPWMIALDRAAKWEKVKTPPKAKVSVGGTAYSQYGFGPESPEGGDKFMFASSVKSAGDFNIDQLPRFTAQADKMLQFTPGGYPTLGSDEASPAATAFYGQQGIDFSDTTALNKVGNIEDFSVLEQTFRDYYNDLLEANPLGTTADSYDNKFWTPAAPAEQKQSKTNLILSALAEGTKFKYSFNKDELSPAATSLFKWRKESTTDKPADGSKPKEPSSDMLTVYSKAIRSRWESIISSETNKQAATDGRIWDGDNNTGFNVYKGTDKSKFEPLPWTTDTGLIGAVAEAELQKVQDQVIQDKIGLNISPPTSYNKMVDLPSSKRKLPVYFDYQPFQSIPLLNPEDTEYTENTPKSFMIDGANVASKGLFIKNRTTDYRKAVSPFQTLNQSANTELPYFSNEESLDAEVQKWAISNFDLPDFSLAGVKLATMYNPIVAEKAFKASSSIRSARTSRKEGAKVDSQEASGAAALLQKMQAPLFYNDDYQLGDNIPYGDAKDIIIGKLPGISEAMQLAAIQDTSMSKDEKRKKIQQEAAKILIKPEHIPSLGNTVWQNVKKEGIPMMDGLKTSSDWIKAASEDGMSPPEEIKNQTHLLDAIDYISWVKSKVLLVTQKAQGQSKEKLAEVQNMASETAFGKYVSAGRFMSQISAGEEGAAAISSKASERLYSKYGSEIDKWTTTENAALATVKKKDGTARGGKESTSKRKFWNIREIIKDKSFADFILGFAAQQRGAQRFNQLITGNGDAKLNQDQTTAIGAVYENFAAGEKAITTDKDGKSSVMKGVGGPSGNQAVDIALPTDINGVRDQFMNLETVYEPEYREVLGGTLLQLGERYATKWAKSGDPGTEEWSSIWTDYSDKLTSLKAFLTARDELLMRPVGLEGEALYPPAVLPALTGGVVNTLKQAGAEVPDDITARLEAAVSNPGAFMGIVQTLLAEASARIPGADSEDYKKRDEAEGVGAQIKKFYNENFASGALPRVFTEEGQEYWKEMKELYPTAKSGWEMFSGGVSGEAASDTTVPFDALDRIYNENQMPSAQGTKYGFYYMKNKKHGTNNTVEAMQREAEAANPKPETKAATATSGSVVDQAVANAATQEVGTPSPPSEEEVKNIVGPGEKPQEPVAKAKGGLIYRAAGGKAPVNWTPRGTDSVPAMLTPGEYVINRSSTQRYLPILEAINNGNSSQGAIAAAVQAGGVPATSYASRGGVISPRYFDRGGGVTSASGVSNSYSMGFDSATLAAIKQFDTSVQAFGEALSQLSIGNIKLDEAALSALGDFATKFDQFTQSLLKLNVPPVISITGQHEVNVNLNGASIFSTMEESVQNMIVNEINKAFGQLSKDNEGGIAMNYRPGPPTA